MTACYVLVNLVYLRLLPLDAVRVSTRIAADAADVVLGRGGGMMLGVLVILSTVGSLTGIILTGPRMYFSMAGDGLAPRLLTHVHPRFRTPSTAIVAQAIWASVLAGTGVYRQLFTRVVYTEWLFFALMAAGLLVLLGVFLRSVGKPQTTCCWLPSLGLRSTERMPRREAFRCCSTMPPLDDRIAW